MPCLCGLPQSYTKCCGAFIAGEKIPETPEALMRSRFSAYAKNNMTYVEKTMKGKPLEGFDVEAMRRSNRTNKWFKLEVLSAPKADHDEGTVEFNAHYIYKNKLYVLHEKSLFKKTSERWYYVGLAED